MDKKKIIFWSLAVLVLGSGIFIRFWQLDKIPPGVHYDEAFNGLDAIAANETGHYQIFYTDNFGREGLHINAEAIFIKLFGISNFSLRFTNALWGSLTLIGFFFLLRQLKFSKTAVLLGSFMLAFSFWHLDFSRTAYRAIMAPLLIVWILYFFLKGLEADKRRYLYLTLSAVLLGLGFYTYIAFRIFPLALIIIALFYSLAQKGFWKKYWLSATLYFFVALITAAPILYYFVNHQKDMVGRTEVVSVFDDPAVPWPKSFNESFTAHIAAFFTYGDKNPRYNYDQQPILPPVWQWLFAFGMAAGLSEIAVTIFRKINYKFSKIKNKETDFKATKFFHVAVISQVVFWLMLVPGVFSIEGVPHTLRIIGTIPGVFILMLIPIEYLGELLKKRKEDYKNENIQTYRYWNKKTAVSNIKILLAGIIVLAIISGGLQAYTYFVIWPNDPKTLGGFEKKLFDLGQLVKNLPLHKNNYIITAYNTAVSKDNTDSSFKTTDYVAYPKIKSYLFFHPTAGFKNINCQDPLIVIFESDAWLRSQYLGACPDLKMRYMFPPGGMYGFWIMEKQ